MIIATMMMIETSFTIKVATCKCTGHKSEKETTRVYEKSSSNETDEAEDFGAAAS